MVKNLVAILLVWFIIEILVWYLIAQFVSGWWVFGAIVAGLVIGISLIRRGVGTLKPMAAQMQGMAMLNPAARPPETKITKAIAFTIAGILFAIPGILSDIVGILVLLPALQNRAKDYAKNYATKNPDKLMQMMAGQMGGMNPNAMGGMMGGMGGFGGMNGQNPFGTANPFGTNNPFGQSPPAARGKFGGTTIDGQAKLIKQKKPANDE